MGIIYQCKIRCFKVKDTTKVNLKPIQFRLGKSWKVKFQQYCAASKENIEEVLAVYRHYPDTKRGHLIVNIPIPDRTNVIAFSNNACDRLDITNIYKITFFDKDKKEVGRKSMVTKEERNNFMVLCPDQTRSINYEINDDEFYSGYYRRIHSFDFNTFCDNCGPCSTPELSPSVSNENCESESEIDEIEPICDEDPESVRSDLKQFAKEINSRHFATQTPSNNCAII